ncbi:hypothetical protein ACNKHO_26360 [Shigella flexneri]
MWSRPAMSVFATYAKWDENGAMQTTTQVQVTPRRSV